MPLQLDSRERLIVNKNASLVGVMMACFAALPNTEEELVIHGGLVMALTSTEQEAVANVGTDEEDASNGVPSSIQNAEVATGHLVVVFAGRVLFQTAEQKDTPDLELT